MGGKGLFWIVALAKIFFGAMWLLSREKVEYHSCKHLNSNNNHLMPLDLRKPHVTLKPEHGQFARNCDTSVLKSVSEMLL